MRRDQKGRLRETFAGMATLSPQIMMLGWSRFLEARYELSEHLHRGAYEICFILRGSVDWWAEGAVYTVGPGDITKPDEPHGGVDALMHPCELFWVIVRAGQLTPAIARRLRVMTSRVFPGSPLVSEIFERLMVEHRERAPDSRAVAETWLNALLLQVLRDHDHHTGAGAGGGMSDAVRAAVQWMEQRVDESYRLDDVAAAVGLGLSQFHARFERETGFSPGQYRTRLRIERAKRHLREGEWSVTELAHRLGFSTSQYFATTFKRYTGMTPRMYRQRVSSARVPL
jgi:AraC family transcriptional regulator, L-rhamnose operon regulatory protein RhaS